MRDAATSAQKSNRSRSRVSNASARLRKQFSAVSSSEFIEDDMMEEAPEMDIDERASLVGALDQSVMTESLHRNSVRASDAHIKFKPGSN